MTNEQIRSALRESGMPCDLTDGEIDGAIAYVALEIKFDYPLVVMGSFMTVPCQAVYDLFNPTFASATQAGALKGGLRAYEMIGCGGSIFSVSDPFGIAPLLQMGWGDFTGISWNSFYTPGDFVIWDQDWAAWLKRYGSIEFEHVSDRPGAMVRISPVPSCAETVLVVHTRPRTPDQIRNDDEAWFLKFVEARSAQILARKFSLCAGIEFAGVMVDQGKTVLFWEKEAKRLFESASRDYEKRKHEAFHPAMRGPWP